MYSYDRTAADKDNDSAKAVKWLLTERKKVIDKAFKETHPEVEASPAPQRG